MRRIVGFDEIRNADAGEQILDAVVDLPQRFFDGAGAMKVAGTVDRDATGNKERAVDGSDDFKRRDVVRGAGQGVAAVGAGVGNEQAGLGKGLEDFCQELRRDVVRLGDIFCGLGDCVRSGDRRLFGEVLEGHEAVVRFFGEPQHGVQEGRKCASDTQFGPFLVYGRAPPEARLRWPEFDFAVAYRCRRNQLPCGYPARVESSPIPRRAQPADDAAVVRASLPGHRDSGLPLEVCVCAAVDRGCERRSRRPAGAAVATEDDARAVPRPDRRQAVDEYSVPGADACWRDSAVRDGAGVQPRPGDTAHRHATVCDGYVARLPSQQAGQTEYDGADTGVADGDDLPGRLLDAPDRAEGFAAESDCGAGADFGCGVCMDRGAPDTLAARDRSGWPRLLRGGGVAAGLPFHLD